MFIVFYAHRVRQGTFFGRKEVKILKIKYFEQLTNQKYLQDILNLLTKCDQEFVPPLSSRNSTTQKNLNMPIHESAQPTAYFEQISIQPLFAAIEDHHVVAFMSLRKNYICEEISERYLPNVYITTVIVDPNFRNSGIANNFYHKLFQKFGNCNLFTRTWSTNDSHIRILSNLKFYEHTRKINDRGERIDTVYYHHAPVAVGKMQILRQYRLTGNLVFLGLLFFFSVLFVTTWILTGQGMLHELSIAFATSLIASALCLLSDTMLKYKESQNDEYINNLKSFGIENLQFHKDELLETIIPKCRHEIWITGYRLIMTGKEDFRLAIRKACERTHELQIRMLIVPPWSETFRLVYGDENVVDNYIKIFSDLYDCIQKYGAKAEIRFTDKPVFNDTYKVDDRFVTSPYLHCLDTVNGKITAKDFFSLDINDPHKQLYELIKNDYLATWDACTKKLDFHDFMEQFMTPENMDASYQEKNRLLSECCCAVGAEK